MAAEKTKKLMADLGLKKKDIDGTVYFPDQITFLHFAFILLLSSAVNFAFDVYDFKGNGSIDAFYVGDVLRACNLNPTLACIGEIGGKEEEGKATISLEAFWPKFKQAKEEPKGGFHDYVEILKLYDKNNDDTMQGNDLMKLLCNLGEKLTKEEAKTLMNELCEPEDEDGFMQFKRKFIPSSFLTCKLQPYLEIGIKCFLQTYCNDIKKTMRYFVFPSLPGEDVCP